MRRFHAPDLPARGRVALGGDEGRHLVRVLRARPGDTVALFDGRGREVEARVVEVRRDAADLEVVCDRAAPRPRREVVLLTAVPRGERMQWLVEKAVEAGVAAVVPLAAERAVREGRSETHRRRWQRAALEAAKQCGRADVPEVRAPADLEAALAGAGAALLAVAEPGCPGRLDDLLSGSPDAPVHVFVGPEGGFSAEESERLAAAGARPFGLGPLVLRVETAAVLAVHLATR